MIALRDGSYWLSLYSAYVRGGGGISITDSCSDTSNRWVETRCVNGLLDNFRSGRQGDDLKITHRRGVTGDSEVLFGNPREEREANLCDLEILKVML